MQQKYAEICSFICKICISLYIAYIAFICTPHFADAGGRACTERLRFDGTWTSDLAMACMGLGTWISRPRRRTDALPRPPSSHVRTEHRRRTGRRAGPPTAKPTPPLIPTATASMAAKNQHCEAKGREGGRQTNRRYCTRRRRRRFGAAGEAGRRPLLDATRGRVRATVSDARRQAPSQSNAEA